MIQPRANPLGLEDNLSSPNPALVAAGVVGVIAAGFGLWAVGPLQFNVVTYETVLAPTRQYLPSDLFAWVVLSAVAAAAFAGSRPSADRRFVRRALLLLSPLVLCVPLAIRAFSAGPPPFFIALPFILGCGWAAHLAVCRLDARSRSRPQVAVLSLSAMIVLLTFVHTRIQINFFDHFMMGHADVGHFTEELKNALAGRGLRCDSFDNTRLGWHFVPLLFLLAPGYALWPSPVYLMTCGAFVLNATALPVYWFARRRSGSVLVGWLFALAWLLLPSLSRLIYSNTYGFQWIYFSVPLLGILIGAAELGRWKTCWIMVAILLLCRETNAAATLGFGLYLALFSPRSRAGIVITLISVGYAFLCTSVLIPNFAAAGRYERLDLFGDLGNSLPSLAKSAFSRPTLFFSRLVRPQGLNLLLLLLTTMFFLPLRGLRLSSAALPTLLPLFLFQNPDWSSIKFWHHATVLPFLYFAGLTTLRPDAEGTNNEGWQAGSPRVAGGSHPRSRNLGAAFATLICAAWGQYFFGFSPLSKSYETYAADGFLQTPDPRLEFVEKLRKEIPHNRTILATERMAAHFTDYKRLYTGRRARLAEVVIIDRSDQWDTSGLPQRAEEFSSHPDYVIRDVFGAVIVFERRANAPLPSPDP